MVVALVELYELQQAAKRLGYAVVTREFLEDVQRTHARRREAEEKLRAVAALRIVADREGWQGWLARRWIRQVRRALVYVSGRYE